MPKPNSKASKWFRVAVEGATTDGRQIQKNWIEEMASQYDPNTFGARINCEHIKSVAPDGIFGAYGDVLAVKAEEVEIGGKTKLALFVQLKPTSALIELNKRSQKIYASVEIEPDFADTGKAYLMGLAVTDNPASLGVEAMQFSAKNGSLKSRKTSESTLFTAAEPVDLDIEELENSTISDLKAKFASLFARVQKIQKDDTGKAFAAMSEQIIEMFDLQLDNQEQYRQKTEKLEEQVSGLKKQVDDLLTAFSKIEIEPERPPVDGGDGQILAAY